MTYSDPALTRSMVLIIVSSVTFSRTARFFGLPGRLDHRATGRLGSASMIVTLEPDSEGAQASRTADVDFPQPPLGDTNGITGIGSPPQATKPVARLFYIGQPFRVGGRCTDSKRVCNRVLIVDG